mgnify:CR=1 FL=1|nr:MAG TPA: hypothetical protein [Caudoviricetes sp.]
MKQKKQSKAAHYQPIIPDADSKLRKRVEAISSATGKKMYIIVRDALEKGLTYYEATALAK